MFPINVILINNCIDVVNDSYLFLHKKINAFLFVLEIF